MFKQLWLAQPATVPVMLYHFALITRSWGHLSSNLLFVCVCVCLSELPCLWAGSWDPIQLHCCEVCASKQWLWDCVCVCVCGAECQVASWGLELGTPVCALPAASVVPCVSACCCVTVTVTCCWGLHGAIRCIRTHTVFYKNTTSVTSSFTTYPEY